jgi:hypothetical protein
LGMGLDSNPVGAQPRLGVASTGRGALSCKSDADMPPGAALAHSPAPLKGRAPQSHGYRTP